MSLHNYNIIGTSMGGDCDGIDTYIEEVENGELTSLRMATFNALIYSK